MDEEKKYYELDIDGFEDIPEYTGPELMTDEYCTTPQFLGGYEATIAWKHAMAARCIEDNREVVFIRNVPFIDRFDPELGVTSEHMGYEDIEGTTIRFMAEARNPKTGEWEEKAFNISTAERSAMIDGELVLEGTKVDGTKYTISAHDFSKELDIERDIRGLPPISQQEEKPERVEPVFEMDDPYTKEKVLEEALGLNDEEKLTTQGLKNIGQTHGIEEEVYDGPSTGLFGSNDGADAKYTPIYVDAEYGPVFDR